MADKTVKDEFIEIYKKYIKREGADELLDYLNKTDFFTAPASSKFHSAYSGGLAEHSINVYRRFLQELEHEYGKDLEAKYSMESIAICGLLHDLCKINYFKEDTRNVKVNGEWVQQPYYTVDEQLPYGHGEKSVYIINGFIRLTRDEAMAINWHMGFCDARFKGGYYNLGDAYYKYPFAFLFHIADIKATYLDEKA